MIRVIFTAEYIGVLIHITSAYNFAYPRVIASWRLRRNTFNRGDAEGAEVRGGNLCIRFYLK